jgi:hypothetical protein
MVAESSAIGPSCVKTLDQRVFRSCLAIPDTSKTPQRLFWKATFSSACAWPTFLHSLGR